MRRRYSWIRNILGKLLGFSGQNLNDKPGGIQGHWIRHSRFWIRLPRLYLEKRRLKIGWPYSGDEFVFGFEWSFWSGLCHLSFSVSTDPGPTFSIGLPPFHFALTTEGIFPSKWCFKWDWYTIGVSYFEGSFSADAWANGAETIMADPWWKKRRFHFDPFDTFLGRHEYSEKRISTEKVEVPMPERIYYGEVRIYESRWKRKRWPWTKRMVRSTIDMKDDPIPFPGKGENSWDCGEDATYSQSSQATTAVDAGASIQKSVMRSRDRHGGGLRWRPEPKKEAASV